MRCIIASPRSLVVSVTMIHVAGAYVPIHHFCRRHVCSFVFGTIDYYCCWGSGEVKRKEHAFCSSAPTKTWRPTQSNNRSIKCNVRNTPDHAKKSLEPTHLTNRSISPSIHHSKVAKMQIDAKVQRKIPVSYSPRYPTCPRAESSPTLATTSSGIYSRAFTIVGPAAEVEY